MIVASCALNGRTGHEAGRALLRLLYLEETGDPLPEIQITPRGKPCFADSPLHFSISHTPRHAFCVLAHCPVGIDAEELDRTIRPSLAERVLSPEEKKRYLAVSDPRRAFLAMWVLKEAAVKLTGEGLHGIPNATDFSPEDPRVREWEGCLVALMQEDPNEGVTYHAF